MSEPTSGPITTDYVEVRFRIPVKNLVKAKQVLAAFGGEEATGSIPWEEVYPNFNPSVALRGARKREGLTQKQLAHMLGISQNHISEMEHGKRPIGKEMAKRLAKALNANYRVFL